MRPLQKLSSSFTVISLILLGSFAALPVGASVIYNVSVNTSAINGVAGNIDLQFNPGAASQAATAGISSFSSVGGTLGAGILTGDASGTLPAVVTLNNTTAFNDLYQSFSFGTSFQFQLVFSGPAITSPNGTAASGSSFALSLFNADGSATLLTTNADGFAGTAQVNLDGSVTTFVYPADNNGSPAIVTFSKVQGVPEPSSLVLMAFSLLSFGLVCLPRVGFAAAIRRRRFH